MSTFYQRHNQGLMEVITALLGEPEEGEPVVTAATFFTVREEGEEVVVTLTGVPELVDPTWGVIFD